MSQAQPLKKKKRQYACRLFKTNSLKKKNSVAFSPQANYTDRAMNSLKEGKTNVHLSKQIPNETLLGLSLPFLETAKESTYLCVCVCVCMCVCVWGGG
jgi:hypothetical protein